MFRIKRKLEFYTLLTLIVTAGIGLWAIYMSYQELKLSRVVANVQIRQNALAVAPIIGFIQIERDFDGPLGLWMKNDGNGPAILDSMTLFYDGKEINSWIEMKSKLVKDDLLFWELDPNNTLVWVFLNPKFLRGTLSPGDKFVIFNIPSDMCTDFNNLRLFLKSKLGIVIYYHSLLGKQFSVSLNTDQPISDPLPVY